MGKNHASQYANFGSLRRVCFLLRNDRKSYRHQPQKLYLPEKG